VLLANRWASEDWQPVAVLPLGDMSIQVTTEMPHKVGNAGVHNGKAGNEQAGNEGLDNAVLSKEAKTNAQPAVVGGPQRIADDAQGTTWRFFKFAIELHPTEAEGYYLNISSKEPKVFVMWRLIETPQHDECAALPVIVTVSYNQAARFMDGGERVDAVPMPAQILTWMRPFVAEHYQPEPRKKVRRNDPFRNDALGPDRPPRA